MCISLIWLISQETLQIGCDTITCAIKRRSKSHQVSTEHRKRHEAGNWANLQKMQNFESVADSFLSRHKTCSDVERKEYETL